MKKIVSGIILFLYCILGMVPMAWADAPPQKIMVITVDNAVEQVVQGAGVPIHDSRASVMQ